MPAADRYADVSLVGCRHNHTLHSSGSSYTFAKACVTLVTNSAELCDKSDPLPIAVSVVSK